MKTYSLLIGILLILFQAPIFAQEYIQVNTIYNEVEKSKELTIEIVNKSNNKMVISNMKSGGPLMSYFEIYFYDVEGQQITATYPPQDVGMPFMNTLPQNYLIIKPDTSLTFTYSIESLFGLCKEPDKIKEMKLKFHIKYAAFKDENLVKQGVYEQCSETIMF